MKEMRTIIFASFFLITTTLPFALADVIYLKNRRSVYGKIIKETKKGVHLKVPNGEVFLQHEYIKKIEKDTEKTEKIFDKAKPKEKNDRGL